MKSLIGKFQPSDCIALVIIISSFIHLFNGGNGTTTAILASVAFYYFGKRGQPPALPK